MMYEWGCNGKNFSGNCSSKLLSFFGLHKAPTGVRWCNNEGVIGSEGVK